MSKRGNGLILKLWKWAALLAAALLIPVSNATAQTQTRQDISLNSNWLTAANESNQNAYSGFEQATFKPQNWKTVDVPHNWDDYGGYRRLKHGNRHGYAWYRKFFTVNPSPANKRYFLYFEGVGSYATVWLNGKKVGYHAGGRTTFTLDVSEAILTGKPNLLAVRADHPAFIKDLPWVCGACSDEVGFSEGSQPMGIFRPVHLIVTNPIRVQPFGVHIWNDTTVSTKLASLHIETEVKNYSGKAEKVSVINRLVNRQGLTVIQTTSNQVLEPGASVTAPGMIALNNPKLWSPDEPYLYQMVTEVVAGGKIIDRELTPYGIRWISWPIGRAGNSKQFFVNGKPFFINGIAEYEHQLGQSHAFSNQQIHTRVMQVKAAGFNAFRDAHQPHNLAYQKYWDQLGILWWPQFSAHIWYDTPEFRNNYKALLVDWVKERRNSPSAILWGLENESKLPADFAKECSEIIRKLDPTASSQRKITTCNGGQGTDWDVPQNWTGTYGGDPQTYATDIQKQLLVGEYGAWRSIDLHTEGPFQQYGQFSEDRMVQLMETKVRLAESVKNNTCGQFFWLLNSHDNPGRVQGGEGLRELDRIGPINYKGLFTAWSEPTDAFYMFRANYAPKEKEPMVYIASHTWPDRWLSPGKKDSITVYSNCDEVELFNDVKCISLGKKQSRGIGTHFQWDGVDIQYNVLYAVGYIKGKAVAEDVIVLNHLPKAPHYAVLLGKDEGITKPQPGLNYIYRVNCGGAAYADYQGNFWEADVHRLNENSMGSTSWTDSFPGMPAMFGSQSRTFNPVKGTADQPLFQSFRYGRDQLKYHFLLPNGEYTVELYFNEPWYGTGGGLDCTGWRVFDVAVNNQTVLKNLDIWKDAGYNHAMKKIVKVKVTNGQLTVSFPKVLSGQAVISAIAIAGKNKIVKVSPASSSLINDLKTGDESQTKQWALGQWMDTGNQPYTNSQTEISKLPSNLYGAEFIKTPGSVQGIINASFRVLADANIYIGLDANAQQKRTWMAGYNDTKTFIQTDAGGGHLFKVYQKKVPQNTKESLGDNVDAKDAQMYIVAVLPVTKMEPATDLKPIQSFKPGAAVLADDYVTIGDQGGKACIKFSKPGGSFYWPFSVGVADIYALRIRYLNTSGKSIKVQLKVLAADGSVLTDSALEFSTTTPDKWKTLNTSTITSINAGNYKLALQVADADGLNISGLEIQ